MNTGAVLQKPVEKPWLLLSAWLSILFVSDLPDILSSTIFGQVSPWLFYGKVAFLALFFGACLLWGKLRPLQPYASVMLVFFLALTASDWVRNQAWWQGLVSDTETSFFLGYLRPYLRKAGVTLVVIVALWVVKRRRSDFFLVRGQLDAPIEPVRWLAIRQGESWRTFGWIFALCAAVAVAVPTLMGLNLSADLLARVVPLIPAVLFFAAINALSEEICYRAVLLSTLPQVIGRNQALLINAIFFGLAHYLYGTPSGLIGFLMTGFLAWLLGKSILETRGLFWAWFIHFLPDVVIFFSFAAAWVQR
jgi:membrane protease YdiL (CAAX protease family)